MRLTNITIKAGAGMLILAILFAAYVIPGIRLRSHVLILYAAGKIPDFEFDDLGALLSLGSHKDLRQIIIKRNPHMVIHNPRTTPSDVNAGARRFRAECAQCHSPDGRGGAIAPSLVGRVYKNGDSDWAIYRTIRYGVAKTAMPAYPLEPAEIWQLAAYLRALNNNSGESGAKGIPEINALARTNLSYDELRHVREPSNEWLTYSGSYNSTRHSQLTSINRGNVAQLAVRWIKQFEGVSGAIEATPIVRSGVMFVTLPDGQVVALNANTGKLLWDHPQPDSSGLTRGQFTNKNRGVALLGDKVFLGTSDARLVALSARTGSVLWETAVADPGSYYISGAPLVYQDLVVTGVGTMTGIGVNGGRGFIAAYDVNTGRERWRFFTIPGEGEIGNNTWGGNSWRQGGAATWLTGSYDPVSDILYWGVGNPKPDYEKASRPGDNLYSNSVVALRGATGKLLWHFQFTPADDHDWDANQIPILVDRKKDGVIEKQMFWANRNGFYYVLNRESGQLINATPFAKQTWADGIDDQGRPILHIEPSQSHKGVLDYPGNAGATNWWSPSFDPVLDFIFVPILEQGMVFFPDDSSSWPSRENRSLYTGVRALEASTGKLAWEHRHSKRLDNRATGGLLSTKSGLLFGGDQSTIFALDSQTGDLLWSFDTGGTINAAPVTYESDKGQLVVLATGGSLIAFGLPDRH